MPRVFEPESKPVFKEPVECRRISDWVMVQDRVTGEVIWSSILAGFLLAWIG